MNECGEWVLVMSMYLTWDDTAGDTVTIVEKGSFDSLPIIQDARQRLNGEAHDLYCQ